MSKIQELALRVMCARCEARPGQPCTTVNGNRTDVHEARFGPIADAYAAGFEDRDGQENVVADE